MAFTYVLSTDIGKCRLKTSDTGGVAPGATATSGYAFEDEEWTHFLTEAGTVNGAVGAALRTLLVDAARRQRAYSVPGLTYNDSGRVAAIRTALATLGEEMPTLTVSGPGRMPFDAGYTNPITGI